MTKKNRPFVPGINLACAVKSLSINGADVHEIELHCKCCQSIFVLRAAHDCHDTTLIQSQGSGLEWFKDKKSEHINMII